MGNIYTTRDFALEKIISLMGYRADADQANSVKQKINSKPPVITRVEQPDLGIAKDVEVYSCTDIKERLIEFYITEVFNVPVQIDGHEKLVSGFVPTIYTIESYRVNREV
ncbi:MAG: hypothetical protein ACP5N2_04690 [Candidatus Nanoarchaeia archaeon]